MALNYKIEIDEELEQLLPPLSKDDYEMLEQSLLKNGFIQNSSKIQIWVPDESDIFNGKSLRAYIVDGHNRYRICNKHNIDLPYWCFEEMSFENKDEVKKYMFENQLARRNLSAIERYEIVERYSDLLKEMAKKNQSAGGKGLLNLTKVNVRDEKAKKANMSSGNYYKVDKIMKSGNEKVKQKLRSGEVSTDKAYQMIKKTEPVKEKNVTPESQISEIDKDLDEICNRENVLNQKKKTLLDKREVLFRNNRMPCVIKYEKKDSVFDRPEWHIYMENAELSKFTLYSGNIRDEIPRSVYISKVPDKYKNEFLMVWKQLFHKSEEIEQEIKRKREEEFRFINEQRLLLARRKADKKDFYKKCYKILASKFHPDNNNGCDTDMKMLNDMKAEWGI